MKISLNKIKYAGQHFEVSNLVQDGLDALVKKIGAQLGAVEETVNYGAKFKEVIIVKVVSCEKHPNADRLNICRIDDGNTLEDIERGGDGLIQVVCGAPNVRAGMLAAWLPPGATVPGTIGKDPFVLETREIRGEKSNGMLASPKELGIGDSHEGLLIIDRQVQPGTPFTEAYCDENEAIIDIENKMFTHRPDCFGVMGVIREIAGIQQKPFKSPEWYVAEPEKPQVESAELSLAVTNELPDLVPRFMAITMSDIKVKPSPLWLQIVLDEVGIRSINNVVDYTNFWMLETGQPLHAYDYDKVKALSGDDATIVVRNPKAGEKIKLLNGKEIEPRSEAIMIATDRQLIGIGGVMGGADTEVDENTKNIILECASFDMYSIRRTSMAHGLFTDAVTRFTKGQSPLQNPAVILKTVESLQQNADGKIASELIDNNHIDPAVLERGSLYPPVRVSTDFINERLGSKLAMDDIKNILMNVEFDVEANDQELTIKAPFWRTDIELREDIVEEVGRLYGYHRLSLALPKRDLMPAQKNQMLELKSQIREQLSKSGANELLTYSFVHGDLLDKVGQDKTQAFQISNALSPNLQYYRLSLMPSLLEKIHPNIKAGYDSFALFEMGKTHIFGKNDEKGLPIEFDRLALVVAANKKLSKGAAYYEAKKYLETFLKIFGLQYAVSFDRIKEDEEDSATQYYEPGRSATIMEGGKVVGRIGEYKASVRKALKLPEFCAGFEVGLSQFIGKEVEAIYQTIPRFPAVTQDISLKISTQIVDGKVYSLFKNEISKLKRKGFYAHFEYLDIYKRGDEDIKHVTLRLSIASNNRTLTDSEVNDLLNEIAVVAQTEFGAERV